MGNLDVWPFTLTESSRGYCEALSRALYTSASSISWKDIALPYEVPYRIDIAGPLPNALDVLLQLGALDVGTVRNGLAAILPDSVTPETAARALGTDDVSISAAVARDNESVWLLSPQDVRIGSILIVSPEGKASPSALRLIDSSTFGTGHHPTTALCIEAIEEIVRTERIDRVLDVGTGSGILALAALLLGVPCAVGLDIDADALQVAAENAQLNQVADRFELICGGPDAIEGNWPLVVANVLAAPLIEMAPTLVRRVGKRGRLVLSGIPWSLESEVRQAYQHVGMRYAGSQTRAGWTALSMQASW